MYSGSVAHFNRKLIRRNKFGKHALRQQIIHIRRIRRMKIYYFAIIPKAIFIELVVIMKKCILYSFGANMDIVQKKKIQFQF